MRVLGIRNAGRGDVTTPSLRCRCDRTAGLRALSHTKVGKLNLLDVGHDWVQERVRMNYVEAVRVDRQSNPSDMLNHLLEGTEHRRQLGQMSTSPGGMVTQCQSQGMLKLFGQRSLLVQPSVSKRRCAAEERSSPSSRRDS